MEDARPKAEDDPGGKSEKSMMIEDCKSTIYGTVRLWFLGGVRGGEYRTP